MRFDLKRVKRATNLDCAGYTDGYVMVMFRGRPTKYIYGPEIPRDTFDKLFTAAFPDRQFQLTIKNKYRSHKIESR